MGTLAAAGSPPVALSRLQAVEAKPTRLAEESGTPTASGASETEEPAYGRLVGAPDGSASTAEQAHSASGELEGVGRTDVEKEEEGVGVAEPEAEGCSTGAAGGAWPADATTCIVALQMRMIAEKQWGGA
jgi:hypothetical protein